MNDLVVLSRLPTCGTAKQSRGFTLIELLVVLGIMSILMGLLLPAVQSVRLSARQTQCTNHLRQSALAILQFESAHGHIPSNGWGCHWMGVHGSFPGNLGQPGSWVFNVLFFLEQDTVSALAPHWQQLPGNGAQWSDYVNVTVPILRCPQRAGADIVAADPNRVYFGSLVFETCGRMDYAINGGSVYMESVEGPGYAGLATVAQYAWPKTTDLNGISYLRSKIRMRDVVDGSSNVFMVGEKWLPAPGGLARGNSQPLATGDSLESRRWTIGPPTRDANPSGREEYFGSSHRTGAPFAMCDGSVHTVSYTIEFDLYKNLGSRRSGSGWLPP